MSELNCQMHVKTATDYDDIFLTSKSQLVEYDNTTSGLSATNTKGAIDELASEKLDKVGDAKDTTVTFTEASTLANVNSGESGSTLWGKVKKMFSFIGTTTLTTTAQTITTAINELKNSIGNSAIGVTISTSVGSNNYTQSYTITKAGYYVLVSSIRGVGGTPSLPNQISVYAVDASSGDFVGGTVCISQYTWNTITTIEYLSVGTHVRTFNTGTAFTSVDIRTVAKFMA